MQELVLINMNEVIIQSGERQNYTDTRANFEKDGGPRLTHKSVDYNRTIGSCWLDGRAFQEFPNTEFEAILDNAQTYIDAKERRERVEQEQAEAERLANMTQEEIEAQALAQAKAERAEAVSKIVVEVDGMKFDGDEESQTRMGRTIAAAVALGVDLTKEKRTWVLADNSIAEVTIAQLAKALQLAGDAQTELWTIPYKG